MGAANVCGMVGAARRLDCTCGGARSEEWVARLSSTSPPQDGRSSLGWGAIRLTSPPQKAFSAPMKRRTGSRHRVLGSRSTPQRARRSSARLAAGGGGASLSSTSCPPSMEGAAARRGRTSSANESEESAATAESTTNIVGTDVAWTRAEEAKLPAALPPMKDAQKTPDQRPRFASVVHAVSSEPCATQSSPAPKPRTALPSSCAECRLASAHASGKGAYRKLLIARASASGRSESRSVTGDSA
eukprot:3735776-Prymnesium_polylepis.1